MVYEKEQMADLMRKLKAVVYAVVQLGSWIRQVHRSRARVRFLVGPWIKKHGIGRTKER